MDNTREYYVTSNLDLAATVYSLGMAIDGLDVSPSGEATFYFFKTEEFMAMVDNFWNRQLRIEPLEFTGARKELLTRIKQDAENLKKRI